MSIKYLYVSLGLCLALGWAQAQTFVFTNQGNWSVTSNWVGGAAPTPGGTVNLVFTNTSSAPTTNNYATGSGFGWVDFQGPLGSSNRASTAANYYYFAGFSNEASSAGTTLWGMLTVFTNAASSIVNNGGKFWMSSGVTNTGVVTLDGSGVTTNSAVIAGSGSWVKNGSGIWQLGVPNSFTGGVTLNAGTIVVGDNQALGLGPVTINGGTLDDSAGSGTHTNTGVTQWLWNGNFNLGSIHSINIGSAPVLLGGNITVTNNAQVALIGGAISDGGNNFSLTKAGGQTMTLSGVSTFGGGMFIIAGQVNVGNNQALSTGLVTLAGGNLGAGSANIVLTNTINLAKTAQFDTTSGNLTLLGAITNTGGLTVFGANRLTLSAANTFQGNTAMRSGTLLVNNALALQNSTLIYTNGLVQFGGGLASVTLGGLAGTQNIVLTNTAGTVLSALTVGGNTSNTTYSGNLSDNGLGTALIKLGSGTLTLTGTNTYTGGTTLTAGALVYGSTNALADSLLLVGTGTVAGAGYALDQAFLNRINPASAGVVALAANSGNDLDLNAAGLAAASLGAVGSVSYTGTNLTPYGSTYRLGGGGGTLTIVSNNVLTGANGLVAFGAGSGGVLILATNNSFTGGVLINAGGTVQLKTSLSLGTNNAVTNLGSIAFSNSGTLTNRNLISGNGSVVLNNTGNVYLLSSNAYSGGTVLSGNLLVGNSNALGTGAISMPTAGIVLGAVAGSTTLTNALAISNNVQFGGTTAGNTGNLVLSGGVNLGGATRIITVKNTNTFAGTIANGGLVIIGGGTMTLSGSNTYAGTTTLSNSTLNINQAYALGSNTFFVNGGTLNNTSGAPVTNANNSAMVWSNNFAFTGSSSLNLGSGAVTLGNSLTVTASANTLTVGGAIADGGNNYALAKAGAGTLTLAGANTYGGGTIINGGLLKFMDPTTIAGSGANVTLNSNATAVAGYAMDQAFLSRFATTSSGVVALAASSANPLDFNAAGLAGVGLGAVATNTFSGALTPFGSTYQLGGGGGTLVMPNNLALTGAGSLLAFNNGSSGTLTLSGSNTFNGGTTLINGILVAGNDDALGTGPVTINALLGNQLQLGNGVTLTNALTINGGGISGQGIVYVPSGTGTYGGAITINGVQAGGGDFGSSGSTAWLFVTGPITSSVPVTARSGNMVFSNPNSSYGTMAVNAGTVISGVNNALPVNANLILGISAPSAFDLAGYNQTLTGLSNSVYASTVINSGANQSALTLNISGQSTNGVQVTGNVRLGLTGAGTLTLITNNTYTGDTTIDAGTLVLAHPQALQNSTLNFTNGAVQFGGGLPGFTFGGLAGNVNLDLTNASGSAIALAVGGNNSNTLYSGNLNDYGLGSSLIKLGTGLLALTGANTYGGGTVVSNGVLQFGSSAAIAGNVTNYGTVAFDYAGVQGDLSRLATAPTGTVALTANSAGSSVDFNAVSLSNAWLGTVGTVAYDLNRLTPYVSGTYKLGGGGGVLNLTNVIAGAKNLVIGGVGGGAVELSASNTYTGGTTVKWNTLLLGANNALPTATALTLGDSDTTNNAGTLDMNGFTQTIGSLLVTASTNGPATALNKIINIAAGQSLNIVTNSSANVLTLADGTQLKVSGAGALNVVDRNGNFYVYGQRNSGVAGLDLTQLGSFTANVSSINVGYNNGDFDRIGSLLLATNNVITANNIYLGNSTKSSSTAGTLQLGLSNTLNVANLYLGYGKGLGTITFADGLVNPNLILKGTGTVTNTRANVTLGKFTATGGTQPIGYLMITNVGASITASLDQLIIGSLEVTNTSQSKGGYGYFTFNAGSVDVNTVLLGRSLAGAGLGTGYGQLTMNGGTLNVNTSFIMGQKGDAGTATVTGAVVFAGGTATLGTDIVDGGGVSSLTLSGGTLDMQNHNIGSAVSTIDTVNFQSGALMNVRELNGGANLVKTGGGTLVLGGVNSYTGGTIVSNGILQAGAANTLPSAAQLYADTLGTFDLNGFNQQVGGLNGYRGRLVNSGAAATLTVNFSGSQSFLGTLSGPGNLTLTGGGTMSLTGTNSFSGNTVVTGGSTYVVNGLHNGGLITALAGGMVGGTGPLSALLVNGGTYAPGNGFGAQLVGTLTLTNAGLLSLQLGNNVNSQLIVTNSLNIAAGGQLQLNLAAYSFSPGLAMVLVDYIGATYDPSQWFTLNDAGGPNNGLVWTNGETLAVSGGTGTNNLFTINYDDLANGGNVITLTAVPEPGTLSLLSLAGIAWLVRRIRRQPRA